MRTVLSTRPAPVLSAYGLFADHVARTPAPGVFAYDLATPLFSDHALKERYVFTPPGQPARHRGGEVYDFPVGTVLVKTFAYPADLRLPIQDVRPLETRLLIRKASGWEALAYVWDANGREARLALAGAQLPVRVIDAEGAPRDIAYAVPNKNQCKGCHALDGALTPIGPRPRNLDHAGQLARLVEAGVLDSAPPAAVPATLNDRARAYLDVNCAHCHNPRGPASNAGLDLRFEQVDPAQWGVRKRPVAAGRASAGFYFAIDPGHPERSILLSRMESTDPGVMMPELGRTLVHREGVDLVRRWIAAMDANGRVSEQE
jgi:uncharacterized repeat protein (TIGR03806 family)